MKFTRFSQLAFATAALATNAIAFSRPVQFSQALESLAVRLVLPTTLGSGDFDRLLEQSRGASAEILERARFSAMTNLAEYLDEWDQLLLRAARGELDQATFRLAAKRKLAQLGYEPPAGEEGTLTDLSSDTRINLRIEMDLQFARGYGTWKHDQAPAILDQWPAQELFRAARAEVPRDWIVRWQDAGGRLYAPDHPAFAQERPKPFSLEPEFPRMIALRNDPIWVAISRFGLPYQPFDYGSHMRTRLIARRVAMPLGLIDRDTQIQPQDRGFNDDLRYSTEIRNEALRQALLELDDRLEFVGDVLTFKEGAI